MLGAATSQWLRGPVTKRIDDDAFIAFAVRRSEPSTSSMLLILDWRGRVVARERNADAAGVTLGLLIEHLLADPPEPPKTRLVVRAVRVGHRAVAYDDLGADLVVSERRLASLGATLLPATVLDIDTDRDLDGFALELARILLLTGVPLSVPASLAQRVWFIARRISNGNREHRLDAAIRLEPLAEFVPDLYSALRSR